MKVYMLGLLLFVTSAVHANPNWKNEYVAANGLVWSDILSGTFVNCVSIKDGLGRPIFAKNGEAKCAVDGTVKYLGISPDDKTITESDAVEACKAIGGFLPSKNDFESLYISLRSKPQDKVKKNLTENLIWTRNLSIYTIPPLDGTPNETGENNHCVFRNNRRVMNFVGIPSIPERVYCVDRKTEL